MSTEKIDFTAKVVPIEGTAGDYLSFSVSITEWDNLTSPVLAAQVRDHSGGNPEDFTFVPGVNGGVLYLLPEQTRRLFELDAAYAVVGRYGSKVWTGKYDIQISHDSVMDRTLVTGPVELAEDVTG